MATETKNQVLKGGEFLIKESTAEDVFIPEELNEEQNMIRQMVKDFVETEIWPRLDELDKKPEGLNEQMIEKAAELGLLGLAIPEEYGGTNLDVNSNTVFFEEIGKTHGFSVTMGAQIGIGLLPIYYFGTEEQKKKYLPDLVSGKLKAAYCLTEPGSGSDALAAKTKAVLSEDGEHYILNGQKMWITNAGFADVFTVFAKIDGEHFSAFIVERDWEGVSLGAEEPKMGIKSSSTRQVFFENVKVPKENLLGEAGRGHVIAFNILNIGRFKLCVGTLGGAKVAADFAFKYALERQQFKQPIANFGAIKHKMAEMAIRCYSCESATYRVSDLLDKTEHSLKEEGKPMSEALLTAAEEYAIECAMLKVNGSETLDYVVDEMVQIYGGIGYSEEYHAARAYRDSRINRIFEGTNEINRLLTMDMLLKRAMKGQLDIMTPAMGIQQELMSIPDMSTPDSDDMFYHERKAIANAKKGFLMVAGAAAQKLMMELQHEQEILMNAADVLMDIFLMESTLLRTEKLVKMKGEEAASVHVDMARCFISDAMERINLNGKHAITAFAEGDELNMMMMGLKRFTKYQFVNTKALRRNVADKIIAEGGYCF
jgi:alkylation response protein AidB-like acyl-CoA dehydrogenase